MSLFHYILPLGLEIKDGFVRAIQLAVSGSKLEVIFFKEVKLPPSVIRQGLVGEHKILREAVEAVVSMRSGKWRIGSKAVVVSLPQQQTYYRMFRFDNVDQDELGQLVEKELRYHIPFSLFDIYYDWHVIDSMDNSLYVSLVAVPRVTVESYAAIVQSAGLVPLALEPEIMALVRIVSHFVAPHQSLLFVFLDDDIAISLVVSNTIIQFVHNRYVADMSSEKGSVNQFIVETLRYYKDHFSAAALNGIFVSQRIQRMGMESSFDGVEVKVFDPLQNVATAGPHERAQLSNDFAIPLGLALREYAPL